MPKSADAKLAGAKLAQWNRDNPGVADRARQRTRGKSAQSRAYRERTLMEQTLGKVIGLSGDAASKIRPGLNRLESALETFWEALERGKPWAHQLLFKLIPKIEVHHHVQHDPDEISARLADFLTEKRKTIAAERVREH